MKRRIHRIDEKQSSITKRHSSRKVHLLDLCLLAERFWNLACYQSTRDSIPCRGICIFLTCLLTEDEKGSLIQLFFNDETRRAVMTRKVLVFLPVFYSLGLVKTSVH